MQQGARPLLLAVQGISFRALLRLRTLLGYIQVHQDTGTLGYVLRWLVWCSESLKIAHNAYDFGGTWTLMSILSSRRPWPPWRYWSTHRTRMFSYILAAKTRQHPSTLVMLEAQGPGGSERTGASGPASSKGVPVKRPPHTRSDRRQSAQDVQARPKSNAEQRGCMPFSVWFVHWAANWHLPPKLRQLG